MERPRAAGNAGAGGLPPIGDEPYVVTLAPYGFFWFLLGDAAEPEAERSVPRETITLVWASDRNSLLAARERHAFERDVLPHFLLERRWFAEKARGLPTAKLDAIIPLERDGVTAALTLISVPGEQGTTSRYLLPLTVIWTRFDRSGTVPANAIAAIRRGSREGTLIDAGTDAVFVRLLLDAMRSGETITLGEHRLEAVADHCVGADVDCGRQDHGAEPRAVKYHRLRRIGLCGEDFPQT